MAGFFCCFQVQILRRRVEDLYAGLVTVSSSGPRAVNPKPSFLRLLVAPGFKVDIDGELFTITTSYHSSRQQQPFPELTAKEYRLIARPGQSDRHPLIVLSENFPSEEAMNAALRNGWDVSGKTFQIDETQQGIIDAMLRKGFAEIVP
jgi:hypothetical protein